jgi:hypothetical protein
MADSAHKANVELVVKLAATLASNATTKQRVCDSAAELGIELQQLDPSSANSELASYHTAFVPAETAERAVDRLRQCHGIEAVYIKPQGEPPNSGGAT